ncbi:hypothetical protein LTR94_032189, partial [Friedmanniomyces endolithicus]
PGPGHQPSAARPHRRQRDPPGQRRLQRDAGAHPPVHLPAHADAGRDHPRPADAAHAHAPAARKGGGRRAAGAPDRRPVGHAGNGARRPGAGAQHGHHRGDADAGSRFAAGSGVRRRQRRRPGCHAGGQGHDGGAGPAARPAPLPGQPDRQRGEIRPRCARLRRPHQRHGAGAHPRQR